MPERLERHELRLAARSQGLDLLATLNLEVGGERSKQVAIRPQRAVKRLLHAPKAGTGVDLEVGVGLLNSDGCDGATEGRVPAEQARRDRIAHEQAGVEEAKHKDA